MCEPAHSITQFPSQDSEGTPLETKIDAAIETAFKEAEIRALESIQKHRINDMFHFSRLGFGHSESMRVAYRARNFLPTPSLYECDWWDRIVRLDGRFHGEEYNRELALESAEIYASKVSIGNIAMLRQFLERSMRLTQGRALHYFDNFRLMLSGAGRSKLEQKLNLASLTVKRFVGTSINLSEPLSLDRLIKIMMGLTRDPHNLTSVWQPTSEG